MQNQVLDQSSTPKRPAVTSPTRPKALPSSVSSRFSAPRPLRNGRSNPSALSQPVLRRITSLDGDGELCLLVLNAPPEYGTLHFHELLSPHGTLVHIEVLESRRSCYGEAKVVFRPPPRRDDWVSSGIELADETGVTRFHVTFRRQNWRPRTHVSPTDPRTHFQEDIRIAASELSFGVMQEPERMLKLHTARPVPEAAIDVCLNTFRKCLDVCFSVAMGGEPTPTSTQQSRRLFRMRLNISQMKQVYQMRNKDRGSVALIFPMPQPPQMFRKAKDITTTHDADASSWAEWQTWYRQTEIEQDPQSAKEAVTQLQKETPIIDIGRWLAYCVVVDRATAQSHAFNQLCLAISHHNVTVVQDKVISMPVGNSRHLWKWLDNPDSVLHETSSFSELHQLAEEVVHLDFELRYQLEVCISLGLIHECNIEQGFLRRLTNLEPARAIKLLEKVADEKERCWDLDAIFRKFLPLVSVVPKRLPTYCATVRSATVTPTTIIFATPAMETSNRVIRQFSRYADYFLRVKFTDEKYRGKIMSHDDATMDAVFTRIKRTMSKGIRVGGRHFEFLAFGNSQFRDGGAWFFASVGGMTAQSIRDWMGNFTQIRVVAKQCARVGQCLSTTRALQIGAVNVDMIPDISNGKHTFTDGVGKISPFLAQMIANQWGLPNSITDYPSVFQFRLGGAKGVLAVDPALTKKTVHIRPSQAKFDSINHKDLNICRISQFSTANLNIQIIMVLSALGVSDGVFLRMMKHELSDLYHAMVQPQKAVEILCRNVDLNQMSLQLAQMVESGFMEANDPFTISCLRLWRSWTVKYLKEKARIPVERGAFVLGCVDETASLKGYLAENEGLDKQDTTQLPEIFIQVPDAGNHGHFKIIEGVCTLARNPSLHPGDVRVVNAVDVPELRHLRNCVVLPQKGDRDLASMCSGGDLDGDDYLVMWDEGLLPQEWNHEPMNYDAPPAKIADGPVTVDDMTSFFVTHMKHDNLRPIAVAHKYWADFSPDGIKDSRCLALTQLHSTAVDYAKTGVPAEMPKNLRVKQWPHWSEPRNKSNKRTYTSKKVIGQLYDMVKRIDFVPAWEMPFDQRVLTSYTLDETVLEKARRMKKEYDEGCLRIMTKYGINSDFEVFTTFALKHSDDVGDYKFGETLGEESGALKDHFQKLCYEEAGTNDRERDWEKIGPFVAAMYTVTAQEVEAAVKATKQVKLSNGQYVPVMEMTMTSMPYMSFPWLFTNELGRIATKGTAKQETHDGITQTASIPPRQQKKKLPVIELGDDAGLEPLQEIKLPDGNASLQGTADADDLSTLHPLPTAETDEPKSEPGEVKVEGSKATDDLNTLAATSAGQVDSDLSLDHGSTINQFAEFEETNHHHQPVHATEDDEEVEEQVTISFDSKPSALHELEKLVG